MSHATAFALGALLALVLVLVVYLARPSLVRIFDHRTQPRVRITHVDTAKLTHWSLLTTRQRQVAEAIERGLSNKEIATELHISVNTVESHCKAIYALYEVHSRLELVRVMHIEGHA